MLRKDGEYKIYIIKFAYKKQIHKWIGAGDCGIWLVNGVPPTSTFDEKHKFLDKYRPLIKPFSANGICWQQTGVHGSYIKEDALKIAVKLAEWNPTIIFRVYELNISQKADSIASFSFM